MKRLFKLLVIGSALGAIPILSPAIAQPSMLKLALCTQLKDDGARLKCFDEAVAELGQSKAAQNEKPPAPPEWEITESRSPIDDSPQVAASLASLEGRAMLVLRCQERKTEAVISPNAYLGSNPSLGHVPALVRINDAPAVNERWHPSSNGRGAFAPNAAAMLKALPDDGTLFVRLTGFSAYHDARFNLGTVSAIREKIREACKWPEVRPTARSESKARPKGSEAVDGRRAATTRAP
jgi:Type VI secretion system VasI, EvfG, VC_A0118